MPSTIWADKSPLIVSGDEPGRLASCAREEAMEPKSDRQRNVWIGFMSLMCESSETVKELSSQTTREQARGPLKTL